MATYDGKDLRELQEKAELRYLGIADDIKRLAGVNVHIVCTTLTGRTNALGAIFAPAGRTRRQLYVLAHECAHTSLGHHPPFTYKDELAATGWAHKALRMYNIKVSKASTTYARRRVDKAIKVAQRRNHAIDRAALDFVKPLYPAIKTTFVEPTEIVP